MTVTVDPTAATDSLRLISMLDRVLERTVVLYETAGVQIPERRYWTLDQPVVDCEQLVVAFIQAYLGPPGDEAVTPQRCTAPQTAVLQIQVHRCVPVIGPRGKAPSAESINTAAKVLATDLMVLMGGVCSFDAWDRAAGIPGMGLGVVATASVTPAQGEYQGVVLDLTLAIP